MKKYIGDKAFYKMVLAIAIPIMIQNGITNFVSLLDNVMVGRIGTEQMSGVAIANQLLFVYNLSIFGAISGASIFGAQFYGLKDTKGVRNAFRFKLIMCAAIVVLAMIVLLGSGEKLILYYLNEEGSRVSGQTLSYGKGYLQVMMFGLIPYALAQSYAGTLRETGETRLPMIAGIVAVAVNLVLNYILIFGKLGAPELGVKGAAIATVVSRFVELFIILWAVRKNRAFHEIFVGTYRHFRIPAPLMRKILLTGTPLLLNEALWAMGMAFMNQCYSIRGLEVVAAMNICSTVTNLFNVIFMALGSSISIVVGQLLGAGKSEEAVDTDRKMIAFSTVSCVFIGAILAVLASLIPQLYNTEELVREIAAGLIRMAAICMPLHAFNHAAYFTMRSGGKTVVTFLFDSVFVWAVSIPMAYCLAHFTSLPILPLYLLCLSADVIKCIVGSILLHKKVWVRNIVREG